MIDRAAMAAKDRRWKWFMADLRVMLKRNATAFHRARSLTISQGGQSEPAQGTEIADPARGVIGVVPRVAFMNE